MSSTHWVHGKEDHREGRQIKCWQFFFLNISNAWSCWSHRKCLGRIRSRRRRNNCAKLCRHPLLTMLVLVMVAVGDIWIIAAGQSRAAAGPNLILNFLPRCSNAVNSGVAIRGQGADQGNIKFDSITNSKVPIPSHPSTEKRAGEAERIWLFCHFSAHHTE